MLGPRSRQRGTRDGAGSEASPALHVTRRLVLLFVLLGRRHRGSTGTANKQQAINEERRQRERLQKSYSQILEEETREQQPKTVQQAADEFLMDYRTKHRSPTYAEYALGLATC